MPTFVALSWYLKMPTKPRNRAALCRRFLFYIKSLASMAETEGFEPSVPYSQYDGLANRWFQPLTHVSRLRQPEGAIAGGIMGGKWCAALYLGSGGPPLQCAGLALA